MIVDQAGLADAFGVSVRTVQRWSAEPDCPIHQRGGAGPGRPHQYILADVINWRLAQAGMSSDRLDLQHEQARLAAARAETAEMQNAATRLELVPTETICDALIAVISECRMRLLGLPDAMAPRVIGYDSIPMVRAVLNDAILDALAKLDPASVFAALGLPDPVAAAPETDDL